MKHAFLIIAHKDNLSFQTLIRMLDREENDLFIHFDAKQKVFDRKRMADLQVSSVNARMFFVDRINVAWGGSSMIRAELILLEKAITTGKYDYYHLLSGVDLPIQRQEDINSFFEKNKGKQFLNTGPLLNDGHHHDTDRVRYYHFFQNYIGRKGKASLKILRKLTLGFQKRIHIHRHKNVVFMRGAQWFSITHELAEYLVKSKKTINKLFRWTYCGDELFLQTIIHGTSFEDQVSGPTRLVDWKRGSPYVFTDADFELIKNSNRLFARKLDSDVDAAIVKRIADHYS